ncbi:MAG: alkaline phosphatase family protein [Muribaculaceae bacterium]
MKNNDRHSYMPRLVVALITSVAAIAASAATPVRPQLVVGIMIDGLDTQYLDLLREQFGAGGFNRLLSQGVVIANADYGTNLDATAATAVLMTGASPSTTSITCSEVYNRDKMRAVQALFDPEVMGNYTTDTFSPRGLEVSTLADEVRIAGGGVTRVYAIAPDAPEAILMAGHSANCAFWLDRRNGNWATSTFYRDVPAMLSVRNRREHLSTRLDTMQWTPFKSVDHYPGLPEHLTHYPFRYVFPGGKAERYDMFVASPMFNTEVTNFAGALISDMHMGKADGVDMINIVYTLHPYDYTRNYDNRYELIDAYLRLDANLERLFAMVDASVGMDHSLFFVAATPPSGRSRRDDEQWNIPYGEFSTKKAKSLLNLYLMGKYGNGEWVSAYHNGQFYLNLKLINDTNLDAATVRTDAASFLTRMSGVDRVYTLEEVILGRGEERLEGMRRNIYAPAAGDLYVEIDPGWELVDDIDRPAPENRIHYVKRVVTATAPVFILAPNVDARTIDTPVDIRFVAPTVARLLRIRSPNAAALPALLF